MELAINIDTAECPR